MTEAPERDGGGRIDVVLSRLTNVRRSGAGWRALCPVHDAGGKHSGQKSVNDLGIREGRRGILLGCFAGCSVNEIRIALDLTWPDLFYEGVERENEAPPVDRRGQALEAISAAARFVDQPHETQQLRNQRGWVGTEMVKMGVGWDGERLTLPVTDENGKAWDVLRYDPGADKFKMLAGKGRSRKPWPAPEFVETKFRTRGLCLVEGEGTAISLASVGLPVVALPGAVARATGDVHRPGHFEGVGWHKAWARRFKKFGRVWLFPDADDVGRNLMRTVAYDLEREDIRPVLCDLGGPKGYDLGDFLAPAKTVALRKQGRDLILMLADVATRDVTQLDFARELMFSWNGWLFEGRIAPPAQLVPEPAKQELAPGEIAWV